MRRIALEHFAGSCCLSTGSREREGIEARGGRIVVLVSLGMESVGVERLFVEISMKGMSRESMVLDPTPPLCLSSVRNAISCFNSRAQCRLPMNCAH